MSKFILSIDQGTSSSRAILFNDQGDVHAVSQKEIKLTYPHQGWVEQNPQELVDSSVYAVNDVIQKSSVPSADIVGVGISNQRETTIVWNKNTGQPVYNAIVWQDRRTADFCATLKAHDGLEFEVNKKTGLLLDPYFSATKIYWILENVDGARTQAENGDLLFGTVDCYLLWHLTNGKVHATDITNASRTMLFNINGHNWDKDLLKLFNIPESMMPQVHANISDFGQLNVGDGAILNIGGVAGDQQAASIGQGCLSPGMLKSTYGTGCFALVNTGEELTLSKNKLLTTIAYKIDNKVSYALEGSIFNAGTAIQFLRDNIGLFDHASDTAGMARNVEDNNGVYFVPAFTGLGAPYWDPDARGVICGIGRDTTKDHIVRAALEAQAYQTRDLLETMEKDGDLDVAVLRVDGGLVANEFMCQFMADTLGAAIEVPRVFESTAWGAACLAGVHGGLFSDINDAVSRWSLGKRYEPSREKAVVDKYYTQWRKAVEKTYS